MKLTPTLKEIIMDARVYGGDYYVVDLNSRKWSTIKTLWDNDVVTMYGSDEILTPKGIDIYKTLMGGL